MTVKAIVGYRLSLARSLKPFIWLVSLGQHRSCVGKKKKNYMLLFLHVLTRTHALGGYLNIIVKFYISTGRLSRLLGFCQNSPLIICWSHVVKYNKVVWEHLSVSVFSFKRRWISGQCAYLCHWKDCGFCSHGSDRQFMDRQQYKIITLAWSWADMLPLPKRIILMNC